MHSTMPTYNSIHRLVTGISRARYGVSTCVKSLTLRMFGDRGRDSCHLLPTYTLSRLVVSVLVLFLSLSSTLVVLAIPGGSVESVTFAGGNGTSPGKSIVITG